MFVIFLQRPIWKQDCLSFHFASKHFDNEMRQASTDCAKASSRLVYKIAATAVAHTVIRKCRLLCHGHVWVHSALHGGGGEAGKKAASAEPCGHGASRGPRARPGPAERPQRLGSARSLWVPAAKPRPPGLSAAPQRGRTGESWAGRVAAPPGDKGRGLRPQHRPAPPGPHLEISSSSAGAALNDCPAFSSARYTNPLLESGLGPLSGNTNEALNGLGDVYSHLPSTSLTPLPEMLISSGNTHTDTPRNSI
nr:uncharacterized protein LOC120365623 [Saimiri boliviensis boliviensis]